MSILSNNKNWIPQIKDTHSGSRDSVTKNGIDTCYRYDCKFRKEDPSIIVKWCRRNFGQRGSGWDFRLISGLIEIDIWDDKYKVMYELWHR